MISVLFWASLFGVILFFVFCNRQLRRISEIRLAKKASRKLHANYVVIMVITRESEDAVLTRKLHCHNFMSLPREGNRWNLKIFL